MLSNTSRRVGARTTAAAAPATRPQCLVQHQHQHQQTRHASLLRRPKRPYTFTQLVTLSDGSTFTQRTTSPAPILRSTKDVRNSPLWNPSSQKLLNIEEDEAGRLKRFRGRFGRGWDAEAVTVDEDATDGQTAAAHEDSLLDLIANYGQESATKAEAAGSNDEAKKSGKAKGGEK